MKEIKICLITEKVTNAQLDKLDKFLVEEFGTEEVVITLNKYNGEIKNE